MGGISSRYNVASRQNEQSDNRRRSSGRSARSYRNSRSSSQPSITVRSPTQDGGFEEVVHEPPPSGLRQIISSKIIRILPCLKHRDTADPLSSSETCSSLGRREVSPKTPERRSRSLSTGRRSYTQQPTTSNPKPNDSSVPETMCRHHLSVESALIQLYVKNPSMFLRRYRHLLTRIPLVILYEVAMKAKLSLPIEEGEPQELQRVHSDYGLNHYSTNVTREQPYKRIPLTRKEFEKHVDKKKWLRYGRLARSEGSDLLFLNDSSDTLQSGLTGESSQAHPSVRYISPVQVHTNENQADPDSDNPEDSD